MKTLVIYGPTSTGKTDLAIKLAKKFNGEIISADSRQVYRGLDIGTGKVSFGTKVEKHKGFWVVDGIKIRGFDLTNPGQQFTVFDFVKFAASAIIQINKVGKLPIVVGGTGFYIKAFVEGAETIAIPADSKLRSRLEKLTTAELYKHLLKISPNKARSMNESDRANPRRLIRAIEILQSGSKGKNTKYQIPNTKYQILGLTAPNTYLFELADNWLTARLDHGLISEVENLLDSYVNSKWLESRGLEYRWLTKYILGEISKAEAIKRLKGDIHSFIRRQKLYFKYFKDIELFDITNTNWQEKLHETVRDWFIALS